MRHVTCVGHGCVVQKAKFTMGRNIVAYVVDDPKLTLAGFEELLKWFRLMTLRT